MTYIPRQDDGPAAMERAADALEYVAAHDREIWLRMGMALKSEFNDAGFSIWDDWSRSAENYSQHDAMIVWRGIKSGGGVGVGSLFHLARENGWRDDVTYSAATMTPEQIEQRRQARLQATAQAEAEIQAEQAQAAKWAAQVWQQAEPVQVNPYLERKQVSPTSTLRQIDVSIVNEIIGYRLKSRDDELEGDVLVVPMRKAGSTGLCSLEFIDGTGRKTALAGRGTKSGAYWATERFDSPAILLVGEGVATVLSASQDAQLPAVAALSCGNLKSVAVAMREQYPNAKIIMLADLDKQTGQADQHAIDAAAAVDGYVAVPDFGQDRQPGQTDFNDLHVAIGPDAVRACIDAAQPVADHPSDWDTDSGQTAAMGAVQYPEFVPFDQRPPDLPKGVVPGIIGQFAEAVADAIQAPRELAAFNALGVVALALQKKIVVKVKQDYSEGVNLYAITASEPGERKSAVVEACKAPIVTWERAAQDHARDVIRDTLSERRTLEKIIDKARTKAVNAKDAEARKQACREIAEMERELPDVPSLPRMLADDITPEAMAAIMAGSGESLGILEAEGGILDTWAGRYSSGVPNLDLVLKGYGGEPVTVDRKGKDPITLRNPRLTIILTPQPNVLTAAGGNRSFMGRGLIGRCLLCMPRPLVGYRDSSKTMDPDIASGWHRFVGSLLAIPQPEQPHEITLSADAYAAWLDFANEVETAQRPDGELEHVRPWASKSTGHVIRIAGLFHMATGPDAISRSIDVGTMQRSMAFVAWAAKHARYCFGCFGDDAGQECGQRALGWIRRERAETVTERAIYQALKGKYSTMDLIRPGISALVDRGALVPMDRESKRGRPSTSYAVNPAIHGG